MKQILIVFLLLVIGFSAQVDSLSAHACSHDKEVLCIDDINKAYATCEKAAHEKGKDVPADLDCVKYFASMSSDCWECICWVAEYNKWPIKGC